MKNKLFVSFTAVIICLLAVVPAAAFEADDSTPGFTPVERTLGLVVDYADVLTPQEESELEARLSALGIENKLEIGVITVDSYEGKSPQGFADDFYDYNGYGYGENDDGFIIVFNTGRGDGNRNIALSTHGKAIQLVNDTEMNSMFDVMIPWLTAEEFAIAFDVFVDESEKAIDISIPLYYIPLSIAVGFVLAFVIVKVQASKLNDIRKKADASDYVGNVVLTSDRDRFLYKKVTKVPIPKQTNSSSSHTGSSGRSHGGGSRSF